TPDSSFKMVTPRGNTFATAIQEDGKIIIGGQFTHINDTTSNGIARLNSNGTLDLSFDPGTGIHDYDPNKKWISSISIQPDNNIIIGGAFTSYDGVGRNR